MVNQPANICFFGEFKSYGAQKKEAANCRPY